MAKEITVPFNFTPRDYQLPFLKAFDSGKKRLIQVWHRRTGKDKVDLNLTVREMTKKVGLYYYYFPTYNQGRKILWDGIDRNGFRYIHHFPKELIEGQINNSEMKIRFKNGSMFQVVGLDNIDNIVGTNPYGNVFSEYSLQNPRGWNLIRPILAENGGWAVFNWTPRGKNHAYKLHEMAKKDPANWFEQTLTADDTKILSPEMLEQERREMFAQYGDDSLFLQEYYCSYTAAILGAYYSTQYDEAEKKGRFTNVYWEPNIPVHTVWDLGISDAMVVGFWQGVGNERRLIDYAEVTGKGLPEVIKLLKDKPYVYGRHFAPHDIEVRELGTGKSRKEIAENLGINFELVPNLPIIDGINIARAFWQKLWVDKTSCAQFLEAIPQYTKEYDEDAKIFKDKPNHDWTSHAADMLRYAAIVGDELSSQTMVLSNPTSYEDLNSTI